MDCGDTMRTKHEGGVCVNPNCEKPLTKRQISNGGTYCGNTCKAIGMRKRPKSTITTCQAPDCVNTLSRSQITRHCVYCSSSCKNMMQTLSIEERADQTYPVVWNNKLREAIRTRDKRMCRECGIKQTNRKLHIHHINYIKEDCTPTNLIALCKSCHSKTNFKRGYWEPYFTKTTNY